MYNFIISYKIGVWGLSTQCSKVADNSVINSSHCSQANFKQVFNSYITQAKRKTMSSKRLGVFRNPGEFIVQDSVFNVHILGRQSTNND